MGNLDKMEIGFGENQENESHIEKGIDNLVKEILGENDKEIIDKKVVTLNNGKVYLGNYLQQLKPFEDEGGIIGFPIIYLHRIKEQGPLMRILSAEQWIKLAKEFEKYLEESKELYPSLWPRLDILRINFYGGSYIVKPHKRNIITIPLEIRRPLEFPQKERLIIEKRRLGIYFYRADEKEIN